MTMRAGRCRMLADGYQYGDAAGRPVLRTLWDRFWAEVVRPSRTTLRAADAKDSTTIKLADVAQSAEHLPRKQEVTGSTPVVSSKTVCWFPNERVDLPDGACVETYAHMCGVCGGYIDGERPPIWPDCSCSWRGAAGTHIALRRVLYS